MAWRTNELQVRTKYDSYASKANLWPADVKRMVDRAALDEERHYAWVADVLQRLGVGHGEDAAVDALDASRERANVGAGVVNQARERVSEVAGAVGDKVGDMAGTVRDRVSGGAGAVANRISGLLDTDEGPLSGVADRVRGGTATARGAADTVEHRAREHPVQTLVIAGIAGFVIGRLLR
jgi:ElaB/YqjD/DUF883 family membrane-anchored ribosome-binding protein